MNYITSPVCRIPLEEERYEIYHIIRYDVSHVQTNMGRVLVGDEPLKLEKPLFEPLALPLK